MCLCASWGMYCAYSFVLCRLWRLAAETGSCCVPIPKSRHAQAVAGVLKVSTRLLAILTTGSNMPSMVHCGVSKLQGWLAGEGAGVGRAAAA